MEIDPADLFIQKVKQHLTGKLREEAMTLAERFEERGAQREKMIIASRLLAKNFKPIFVAKVTELSLSLIEELEEGVQLGIKEERTAIALRLLATGKDSVFIAKITGLSLPQIEELKKEDVILT